MRWRLSPNVRIRAGRITAVDAARQMKTAREILRRFDRQPGVILADEVGMGKTYVAMAVAASIVEATDGEKPVVVMVPAGVQEKWPREWEVFRDSCLRDAAHIRAATVSINRPAPFFKLLDDPVAQRQHIIFLTHGALTSSLVDPYVRLAILRRALQRKVLAAQRAAFPRWAGDLIRRAPALRDPKLVGDLLDNNPRSWRRLLEAGTGSRLDDDPVPAVMLKVLRRAEIAELVDALTGLPLRSGPRLDDRLRDVRAATTVALQDVWRACMREMEIELPLLILDEAHHLKNPRTQFAGLFASKDARKDADTPAGPLAGVFDRMLFLTATPFQLGHHELIEVLRRFSSVRFGDGLDRQAHEQRLVELERALSATQAAALRLDRAWGRIRPEEVPDHEWWKEGGNETLAESLRSARIHIDETRDRIRAAERLLKPLLVRHVRDDRSQRRNVLPGRAIATNDGTETRGLEVQGPAILPFLLAARAQALVAANRSAGARALFSDGLASSFEAYRETRSRGEASMLLDDVEDPSTDGQEGEISWYLGELDRVLPAGGGEVARQHPKILATTERVLKLWRSGEKVLVFCFYVATGRALRAHISAALEREILALGAQKLRLDPDDRDAATRKLEQRSERFFDPDAPVTRVARAEMADIFGPRDLTDAEKQKGIDAVLRFVRTPSFLARYVDLADRRTDRAFRSALAERDESGRSLRERFESFATFLEERVPRERAELLEALDEIHTGAIFVAAADTGDAAALRRRQALVPNVRLANGSVAREARHRLMLAFNTPFLPEVLIASAVMGEGVDLHLDCRHVIHHDLDWNPSVLEQRTGRLDRLGSKAELSRLPIAVYEPFLEGTQDEKQFRVVKDRERWFNVVMGESLQLDEWATDQLAKRVPLPPELARELSLRLEIVR